jgi:DNA repair exonuclease SbcCD ATPase subunit
VSHYSYGNRVYSLNEAKNEKGKDIHIIAALKAEIKKTKNPSEKKKLTAKLLKYSQKDMNEARMSKKEIKDMLDKDMLEKARFLWKERNKTPCPHCGQPHDKEEAKKRKNWTKLENY